MINFGAGSYKDRLLGDFYNLKHMCIAYFLNSLEWSIFSFGVALVKIFSI